MKLDPKLFVFTDEVQNMKISNTSPYSIVDIIESYNLNYARGNMVDCLLSSVRPRPGTIMSLQEELSALESTKKYLDREINLLHRLINTVPLDNNKKM